jgi:hypothetical protein
MLDRFRLTGGGVCLHENSWGQLRDTEQIKKSEVKIIALMLNLKKRQFEH